MKIPVYYTGISLPVDLDCYPDWFQLIHTPTIQIRYEFPPSFQEVENFLEQECDLVFLSKHGVYGFDSGLKKLNISPSDLTCQIWTLGESTAQAAAGIFGQNPLQSESPTAAGLIKTFEKRRKVPVLLVTGQESRQEFSDWLHQQGWKLLHISVYHRKVIRNRELLSRFQNHNREILVFTSPSTVKGFLSTMDHSNLKKIQARIASIGPTTSQAIEDLGGVVFFQARYPRVPDFLFALTTLLENTSLQKDKVSVR